TTVVALLWAGLRGSRGRVPDRRRNGSSARSISRAMCAANQRGCCDMKLQDLATSIGASEDEDAARQLLRDADVILRGRIADAPPDFVAQVFAGAAPEDLVHYHASEIAEIAESTWRFLDERRPQTP